MTYRQYQADLDAAIVQAWGGGALDVAAVLPTGGGKTVLFSNIIAREPGASAAVAHRQELVSQMSLALARQGVRHRVIGPDSVAATCRAAHHEELNHHLIDPSARVGVCGIDTLVRRDAADPWLAQVGLVVTDEGHHMLRTNKWGTGRAMFKNARGLAVTATPLRADGKGLGRHADGLIDALVEGPGMRELIDLGYLTPYRIFAPPNGLDLSNVATSAGGDFSPPQVAAAVKKARITGDVVGHYQRIAAGLLGITFAVDIDHATELCEAYRAAGVPAEVVTSKTPDDMRRRILRRFKARDVLQLVNVDLFGEGFDVPAVEVISFARPTQSYGLYCQQFGRVLRILQGKRWGIVIDHVGNVHRHGLPDAPRVWSLDRRDSRGASKPNDAVPVRTCLAPGCYGTYERILVACPYCGHVPEITNRSGPQFVDGVLEELDPAVLDAMRGTVAKLRGAPPAMGHLSQPAQTAVFRNHQAAQLARVTLERTMALYGGWQTHALGRSVREAQQRFFWMFGIDMGTAQTLDAAKALALEAKIREQLDAAGVTSA
ncbi:MAG: DEAD/DEAH box helicase [Haliea sp.]|nr:MAG: DEAD/DEAH box helicase [Haliea sp.]